MNADAFRHLYAYHFAANRKIWDEYIMPLEQDKFVQNIDYSVGSVRNHSVHLISVDNGWFCGLRGVEGEPWLNPADYDQKEKIRSKWDEVEAKMQGYLDQLTDEMLLEKIPDDDSDEMHVWKVLLHVANHGTDHRAQMLFILNNMGVKTSAQDYFFYIIGDL